MAEQIQTQIAQSFDYRRDQRHAMQVTGDCPGGLQHAGEDAGGQQRLQAEGGCDPVGRLDHAEIGCVSLGFAHDQVVDDHQ